MAEHQRQKRSFAEKETEILKFWEDNQIFKKSLEKKSPKGPAFARFFRYLCGLSNNASAGKEFIFYDGPPFATGLPHYGHILAGTIKDVIPRFKTMQGYRVPRRWGWDCHGLPVENEAEKELGFKTKKDIENYGIGKFNARARELVMRYADDWRKIIPRLGRWVDMEKDYRTADSGYTESVWWVFKALYDKGLIYQGFKSMHLCPRCETTLSNFEVTQGYRDINDLAVYVKFKLETYNLKLETNGDVFAVAWTTTTWTLPGNAALAVNPERDYALVEITASNSPEIRTGDTYIVGAREEILKRVFSSEGRTSSGWQFDPVAKVGSFSWNGEQVSFSAKKGVNGKELVGVSYQPLFDYYQTRIGADTENADKRGLENISVNQRGNLRESAVLERGWRIYGGDFVTEEDGTGIVHIAPAFGEDDYQLAMKEKLPFIQHIAADGSFEKAATDFAGMQAKPKGNPRETDEKIAAILETRGSLLKKEDLVHPYPHCWRCETPLLNYAAPSWFVKVTELREKLVEENKKIKWIPKEVGEYRFGNWLAEAKDWAISRSRFWGAPIPVWRCERCNAIKVVGSLDELKAGKTAPLVKLILLRHGESEKNFPVSFFDSSNNAFGLTRRGRSEARRAAKMLRGENVSVCYTSPVRRCRETAAIISEKLNAKVEIDERLREVNSGSWDGKPEDAPEVTREKDPYNALPIDAYYRAKRGGNGESWEDVEKRMKEFLEQMLQRHAGETIVVVSHEGPLVYLLKAIDSLTVAETEGFFKKNLLGGYATPYIVYVDGKTAKEFDQHRPRIDEIVFNCSCGAKMRRVPEVFDCWFESGAMPYGQAHYPFERDGNFDPVGGWFRKLRGFPAHFIAEGLDQTRGWFYSLLVLGVALFGKSPYQSVIVNGIILAENGAKMSKRLKNYHDPLAIAEKYGADSLRYYLLSSPVVRGEEIRFSERGVQEVAKKVFNRLDNVLSFYRLYMDVLVKDKGLRIKDSSHILDRWIIARLNQLIREVTEALEAYEIDKAARPIGEFVDDLSTWYLRRSRERIKSAVVEEKEAALSTLGFVLRELSKLMAPFAPFFAEYLYGEIQNGKIKNQNDNAKLKNVESVHLEKWPYAKCLTPNAQRMLAEMEEVRRIVSLGLEARAKANIKVRQPLASLRVKNIILSSSRKRGSSLDSRLHGNDIDLIKDEVNVKKVVIDESIQNEVELDMTITPELKDEGAYRELARFVQDMRKRQGFRAGEFAVLTVAVTGISKRFIEQRERELARVASLKDIVIQDILEGGESFQAGEIILSLKLLRANEL